MSSPAIATHEQLGLVALSVAVAIVAGYLALDLAQRSAGATGVMRRAWIVAGGLTIGLGIWSMHFIGMVALKMAMPVSYDLPLVALSMIAAIGGSVVALDICWNATLVAFSLVIAFGASLAALFRRRRLPLRRQGRRRNRTATTLADVPASRLQYS
jgi:NO-binding membrane sensor protein with MHYT domain